MSNVINILTWRDRAQRKAEIAQRNRENYNLWRARWNEYWAMMEYEDEWSAYQLMTGWRKSR